MGGRLRSRGRVVEVFVVQVEQEARGGAGCAI